MNQPIFAWCACDSCVKSVVGRAQSDVRLVQNLNIDIVAQICKYLRMTSAEVKDVADLLKALGEYNRLSLVYRLCECQAPQNVMCLCECCTVDASGVSRHLKILAREGVISAEKNGREVTYSLNKENVVQKLRSLADKLESSQ